MDPSISDILDSVTRSHNGPVGIRDDAQQQQDLQALTHAWVSERVAPELLPYPTELVNRVMGCIRRQVSSLELRDTSKPCVEIAADSSPWAQQDRNH